MSAKNAKLGILLYEHVQPMDVIGPWEVFSFWKNALHAPLDMFLIAQQASYVSCANGITLKADCDLNNAPLLDYFIVPGGYGRIHEVNNEDVITFIKKQAAHSQYIASVCTGAFLLRQAGLLEGKSATTYWRALPELSAFPDVQVVEERVVKSGNIWMSGGVSSGIDLALALIAEIAGKETAGQVQLLFEYFPSGSLYCSQETAHTLPAYGKQGSQQADLPAYIKRYIESKTK